MSAIYRPLMDGDVTASKIAAGAVDSTKLAAGAVNNTALAADAVDAAKIAAGAVGAETAAMGLGAVGSFAFLYYNGVVAAGTNYSTLKYSGLDAGTSAVNAGGSAAAGTWQARGSAASTGNGAVTLFQRVA